MITCVAVDAAELSVDVDFYLLFSDVTFCHLCSCVWWMRVRWLPCAVLEFGQLKPLLSTVYGINPQIYICWHFARSLDTCAELLSKANLPAYIQEVSFCIVLRAYPYASGLERRKSAGSRPAIPFSELTLLVNSQDEWKNNLKARWVVVWLISR